MPDCIDLKARFGKRYRVACEESREAEYGDGTRARDPWLWIILCQHGHIYPHGGELLGVATNRRGPVATRLAALPCVRVAQDGSDGINAVFHVDHFAKVAEIVKPRRRRQLTPEQRAASAARLQKYRFAARQSPHGDRRREAAAS